MGEDQLPWTMISAMGTPEIAANVEPSARNLGALEPFGTIQEETRFICPAIVVDVAGLA